MSVRNRFGSADGTLSVTMLSVGPMDNDVYVVGDNSTGDGTIIDAADNAREILEAARGIRIRYILQTHGHSDHVQALADLKRELRAPVGVHPADASMLPVKPDFEIADGDEYPLGDTTLRAISTPGHTSGGVCFYTPGFLFSGDTLFPGGPGNTRGDAEAFDTIINSIRLKLFSLPGDTLVLPGHGKETTIGTEREHLEEWIERGW